MGKKSSDKKRRREEARISKLKGNIVEQIVAAMHDMPEIGVQWNVRLPTLRNSSRKREIDVLLTASMMGYPIQIAFECKNERMSIGSEKIDSFVGKLLDVRIPLKNGIYVSASGYTKGAIDRAKEVGIRPLILTGLTEERIASSVREALQSVIYLLLKVIDIKITNDVPNITQPERLFIIFDKDGKLFATTADLIWQKWLNGEPPSIAEEREIQLGACPRISRGRAHGACEASSRREEEAMSLHIVDDEQRRDRP